MLFRGGTYGTMLRSEAYDFVRLGSFIERADNTARILDVKYHILLPEAAPVGGSVDFFHWSALLRSVAAYRSYHRLYRDAPSPRNVAEFLILKPEMPRSLISCLTEVEVHLENLARLHGRRAECHRMAGAIQSQLRYGRIDDVFQTGLHEFLTDFISRSNTLGSEISQCYLT